MHTTQGHDTAGTALTWLHRHTALAEDTIEQYTTYTSATVDASILHSDIRILTEFD